MLYPGTGLCIELCLFACFLRLIITGFTFQNPEGSDFPKGSSRSPWMSTSRGLIIIIYYIGTLEFPIITAKMVWIFMMASFTSQALHLPDEIDD